MFFNKAVPSAPSHPRNANELCWIHRKCEWYWNEKNRTTRKQISKRAHCSVLKRHIGNGWRNTHSNVFLGKWKPLMIDNYKLINFLLIFRYSLYTCIYLATRASFSAAALLRSCNYGNIQNIPYIMLCTFRCFILHNPFWAHMFCELPQRNEKHYLV